MMEWKGISCVHLLHCTQRDNEAKSTFAQFGQLVIRREIRRRRRFSMLWLGMTGILVTSGRDGIANSATSLSYYGVVFLWRQVTALMRDSNFIKQRGVVLKRCFSSFAAILAPPLRGLVTGQHRFVSKSCS